MKLHRRMARVVADEGFAGVWRQVRFKAHRVAGNSDKKYRRKVIDEYDNSVRNFERRVVDVDFPGLDRFYWYHTIDLGDGIITPGVFDLRNELGHYNFPNDMSGMHVLDVGSATGFFAFEFEKRGASVTSVELPSIADWDMPPGADRDLTLQELMNFHQASSVEELHYLHLDGPFRFCHERLHSKVTRVYSTIYDLYRDRLNLRQFDLVFLGDMLLHVFSPLSALSAIAPLCRERLIVSQIIPDLDEERPLMLYTGGDSRSGDNRSWWLPNRTCFSQMLKRLGFQTVDFPGKFQGVSRSAGSIISRTIIHATK